MAMRTPTLLALALLPALFIGNAPAQLLSNLEAFGSSVSLIDPDDDPTGFSEDGPKELATADFDGDGQPDLAVSKVFGRVAVVFGEGGKEFTQPLFLDPPEETGELRSIVAADFDGDGIPDIAVAAPYSSRVVVFRSRGDRSFDPPTTTEGWLGVRALLPLDLDGDSDIDLLAAGPVSDNNWSASTAGARALVNDGAAGFTVGPHLVLDGGSWHDDFPKPVFAMAKLAPISAGGGERAVLTHPNSDLIWIVEMSPGAVLSHDEPLPSLLPTRSLAVGAVTSQGGFPDLVQAAREENQILVRPGDGLGGFDGGVVQRHYVPGEPRAVKLADVDADGWLDLLVVLRQSDRVVTFHNEAGELKLAAEAPVGVSPRDLEVADFNGDGRPDLAVSNRRSNDISVLLTQPDGPGFERLDSVYPVDGGVSGLLLNDVNGDGLDDVIQTHLITKEVSVRLAAAGGVLGEPTYTKIESPPLAMRPGDFNGDGRSDLVIVHSDKNRPGISMLFGNGIGGFDPPAFLPSIDRFFSIIIADFDDDGIPDAAVGNYDCRLSTFKGLPGGEFELRRTGLFTYEARAMIAGDFDADGDIDLAGASATGKMTIVENDGFLVDEIDESVPHEDVYIRHDFPSPSGKGRIKSILTLDWNGDADPDLAINSKDGVAVFIAGEGLTFEALPQVIPGTRGASDLALGDFDNDGVQDLATACQLLSCVIILKGQEGGGSFELATVAPVPSSDYIAVGDIDGDDQPDIAGTGEVLWIAFSSRAPSKASGRLGTSRPAREAVVINEVLASNKTIVLGSAGKTPDVLELYNGRTEAVDLAGWTLTYKRVASSTVPHFDPVIYTFPEGTSIDADSRLVVFCDDKIGDGTEVHTTFKLASEGATLTLREPDAQVADEVVYEEQEPDLSYGRFTDGVALLSSKREPDIGAPNFSFGASVKPEIKSVSIEPNSTALVNHRASVQLIVKAEDEVGIFTMDAVWRTMDGSSSGRLGLYDDGMNGDGGSLDGTFSATLPPLNPGTEVEFFLQATNLIDKDETAPGDPVFSLPGLPVTNYAFSIPETGVALPTIEISEVQAHSRGITDAGSHADYIEVRNIGDEVVDLEGLGLRDSLFDSVKSHSLSGELAPGEHHVFFADGSNDGPDHMPFKLSGGGDSVWLIGLDELGVATVMEKVRPPEGSSKASWSRLGAGGDFALVEPTPGTANIPEGSVYVGYASEDRSQLRFGYSAAPGVDAVLESKDRDSGWSVRAPLVGNGYESFTDLPIGAGAELFRVRE